MQKRSIFALVVVVTLIATALGVTTHPVSAQGDNPFPNYQYEKGAKLTLSGWGDASEQKIVKDSIARFNKIWPDITVDYQPVPADFQTTMKAKMSGGTAPDVFYVDNDLMTAFGRNNLLLPLDDYMKDAGVKPSDFIQPLYNNYSFNGKQYALPKDFNSLMLVYLPEFFQKAGVAEPTDSWTWDDLKNAAKTITEKAGVPGLCSTPDVDRWAALVLQNGGQIVNDDNTKAVFNSPQAVQAMDFWYGMYKDQIAASFQDLGKGWCGEVLGSKLAAMGIEGGWMFNYMNTTFPNVKYKAAHLPKGPKSEATLLFTNGFGVNKASKSPRAAALLALYLTSEPNQKAIQDTGFALGTRVSLIDDPYFKDHPNEAVNAYGGKIGHLNYFGPNDGEVKKRINDAANRIFLGKQSIQEAFDLGVKQVNEEVFAKMSTGAAATAAATAPAAATMAATATK